MKQGENGAQGGTELGQFFAWKRQPRGLFRGCLSALSTLFAERSTRGGRGPAYPGGGPPIAVDNGLSSAAEIFTFGNVMHGAQRENAVDWSRSENCHSDEFPGL